jgi:endonuclease YncB( thermonuclease family)
VRAADRQLYSIALLGTVPLARTNARPRDWPDPAKARLSGLVLSNQVEVTMTWIDERRRGVGVVRVGPTNINAAMVESGLAKLNRDFIKPLPLTDQYALIRADRRASERRLAASPSN